MTVHFEKIISAYEIDIVLTTRHTLGFKVVMCQNIMCGRDDEFNFPGVLVRKGGFAIFNNT